MTQSQLQLSAQQDYTPRLKMNFQEEVKLQSQILQKQLKSMETDLNKMNLVLTIAGRNQEIPKEDVQRALQNDQDHVINQQQDANDINAAMLYSLQKDVMLQLKTQKELKLRYEALATKLTKLRHQNAFDQTQAQTLQKERGQNAQSYNAIQTQILETQKKCLQFEDLLQNIQKSQEQNKQRSSEDVLRLEVEVNNLECVNQKLKNRYAELLECDIKGAAESMKKANQVIEVLMGKVNSLQGQLKNYRDATQQTAELSKVAQTAKRVDVSSYRISVTTDARLDSILRKSMSSALSMGVMK